MKWELVKLKTISTNIQTGPFGSQLHQSDYSKDGIPVVMPKDIANGIISEESIARVDQIHVDRLRKHVIKQGDIIYSRRGDVGRCAYTSNREEGWLCGTGCLRITINHNKANSKFIFYQLQLPLIVGWVVNHAVGSTMLNLNTEILGNIPIRLPSLQVQKNVADILSAYDSLIENNQKQIKLLEEAAQRLYKEWFVDLRFPGYEETEIVDGVPKGWNKGGIDSFIEQEIGGGWGDEEPSQKCTHPAYVIRGTDLYGITHGDYKNIPFRFHTESNLKSRKLQNGDIIFEVSGGSKTEGPAKTCLVTNTLLDQFSSPVICASFCKRIRPKEKFSQYLFDTLQYLRRSGRTSEYDKKSASNIVNYRWKDFLSQEYIILPNEVLLSEYNKISRSIYLEIQLKSIQIEKAKQARDRLLPKLMSGEIEV